MLDHSAADGKMCLAKSCIDRLERSVAIGPIHAYFKHGRQRNAVPRHRQAEVRHARFALDVNGREGSFKMPSGLQKSRDSLENAQVGVFEHVVSGERSVARVLRCPGAEGSLAADFASWLGIRQYGVILHRDI